MVVEQEKIIALLRQSAFFQDWEQADLETLCANCARKVFNVGEALWTAGEPGDGAFILLSGKIERTQLVRPDGQRSEHYDSPGDLVSLSTLVQPWEHTSSGTPLERCEVLELKREKFMEMFERDEVSAFRIVDAIATNLVEEMRDSNRRLHKVFGQPAETLRMLRRRMRENEG